jgi:hypothetical protein
MSFAAVREERLELRYRVGLVGGARWFVAHLNGHRKG